MLSVGIKAKVHLVINSLNIDCLDETIRYFASLGVYEIRILRLVYNGNAVNNWNNIGVDYSHQNKAIVDIFNKLEKYPVKITISGFPDMIPCRPFKGSYKCQGGTNVLYVTFEGDVYPCACTKGLKKYRIGHVSEINKIIDYRNNSNSFNDSCLNSLT
jgi:MoaA/NifB/PqqE/SkfB family radical SAM enzyme